MEGYRWLGDRIGEWVTRIRWVKGWVGSMGGWVEGWVDKWQDGLVVGRTCGWWEGHVGEDRWVNRQVGRMGGLSSVFSSPEHNFLYFIIEYSN